MNLSITIFPQKKTIIAEMGELLYDALNKSGINISADCGKNGKCGKCKVKILKGNVDSNLVDDNGFAPSCKVILTEDLEIEIQTTVDFCVSTVGLNDTVLPLNIGIALDIGTTTLAAALVDLTSGKVLKTASCFNPQRIFGSDVLSRITASQNGNFQKLHNVIITKTNEIINALIGEDTTLQKLIVVGNTIMLHIFAGEDPSSLGMYPFSPKFLNTKRITGKEIGICTKEIVLLPSASAYIGADITSGVLFCDMFKTQKNLLLVDIGTNGEMVLSVDGRLYATSTAAGPALEGASMECGLSGSKGAINKVFLRGGKLEYTTIENKPAKGICGSGYIDIIAILLREKLLNENGSFIENTTSSIACRIKDNRFYLTEDIYVSRQDISEFQLAKSAIYSGIKALLSHCKVDEKQIEALYLAGGMGYYINSLNAAISSIIPFSLYHKVESKQDSALNGAVECVIDNSKIKILEEISQKIEHIELSFSEDFKKEYLENVRFLSDFE